MLDGMGQNVKTKRELAEEIKRLGRPSAVSEPPEVAGRMVAGFILKRWADAGVVGYALDAERRPVPAGDMLQHAVRQASARSPSGKTLFFCRLCGGKPSPIPPSGVCRGEELIYATPEIGTLLARGVLYVPRTWGGLPLPPPLAEPATGR